MSKEWINNIGSINKSKAGKLYIKVDKTVTINEGDRIVLKKKTDEIDDSVAAGKISEEYGEELKEKLHFVKYVMHLPPSDE